MLRWYRTPATRGVGPGAPSGDYVETDRVFGHEMDDPVRFDVHVRRVMFPLCSPGGMLVELLAARHPVEPGRPVYVGRANPPPLAPSPCATARSLLTMVRR